MKKYTYIILSILGFLSADIFAAAGDPGEEVTNIRLFSAIEHGRLGEVASLIEEEVDLEAKCDRLGSTALGHAVGCAHREGSLAAIDCLIAAGADVNTKNKYGMTSLMSTLLRDRSRNRMEIVDCLLAAGANVNERTKDGFTTLMCALCEGQYINRAATVGRLLAAGADVNGRSEQGRTALMFAALSGHAASAKLLLAVGADMEVLDIDGVTAEEYAKHQGHDGVAALFSEEKNWRRKRKIVLWGTISRENGGVAFPLGDAPETEVSGSGSSSSSSSSSSSTTPSFSEVAHLINLAKMKAELADAGAVLVDLRTKLDEAEAILAKKSAE